MESGTWDGRTSNAIWVLGYIAYSYIYILRNKQGLSQDFRYASPKQQFQNFGLSRFSYSATPNPYTNYI